MGKTKTIHYCTSIGGLKMHNECLLALKNEQCDKNNTEVIITNINDIEVGTGTRIKDFTICFTCEHFELRR